jgi:hypothetical protein
MSALDEPHPQLEALIGSARERRPEATVFILPRADGQHSDHSTDTLALFEEAGLAADYATDPMAGGVHSEKYAYPVDSSSRRIPDGRLPGVDQGVVLSTIGTWPRGISGWNSNSIRRRPSPTVIRVTPPPEPLAGTPMRQGAFRPGSLRAWQAISFLLGAEATLLLVWHVSGFQYSYAASAVGDLASMLLGIAPLLTILAALGFGWIDRRPAPALALVVLTLVGPALIAIQLSVSPHFLQGPGGLLATPACTAAAAGLVSGLRRRPGRGYAVLASGGVVGFLTLALPMWALGVGNVAECPLGCDPLEMRGFVGAAIVVGVIGLVTMTPGFAIGSLIGRWLRDPSGQEST